MRGLAHATRTINDPRDIYAPNPTLNPGRQSVDADLDTLATALYATTDDLLKAHPERVPWRPAVGSSHGSATPRSLPWR